MDFIKRPYKTDCRFFANSDTTVTLQWYPCLPGVPALDYPTPFLSRRWNSDEWINYPIGEVWAAPQPFTNVAAKPSATGGHQCGTADQWLGLTYPPVGPPVTYNADGLPTCCGLLATVGGLSWGGRAIVSGHYNLRSYGGISWTGTAIVSLGPTPVYGSGGISWTGTAVVTETFAIVGTGGESWTGTAVVDVVSSCLDGTLTSAGPNCFGAVSVTTGTRWRVTRGSSDQWISMLVAHSVTYAWDFAADFGNSFQAYAGTSCLDAGFVFGAGSAPASGSYTVPSTGVTILYVLFFGGSPGDCSSLLVE